MAQAEDPTIPVRLKEVLPSFGELYHTTKEPAVLCKPKIMPLKSITLQRLEEIQKEAQETLRMQDLEDQAKLDEAKADDAAAMALTAGAAAASRMDSPGETEEAHELQESSGEVNPSAPRAESEDPESS